MDLAALIALAIERKQGDKEFALSFDGDGHWWAQIGNPSDFVSLGESVGEFIGKGEAAELAVTALLAVLPRS
jgi:hypothetical protein